MARLARGEPRDVAALAGDWRPRSGRVGLDYEAAVEEALCFGWVDSTGRHVDDERSKLYFARRKPRSVWAASNKARVERLIDEGRMAPAGLAAIARAKANGSVGDPRYRRAAGGPAGSRRGARGSPAGVDGQLRAFPPSARRMLLGWVALARRPETRAARIAAVAEAAARNERARG